MDKEINTKIERQKYQMHKEGYDNIVNAILSIPPVEVNIPEMKPIDMSDTNKILEKLVEKMNEPICIELNLI